MTVFTVVVIAALARGLNIQCGCFGTASGARVGAVKLLPREEEPQIIVPMIDVLVQMPGASATPLAVVQPATGTPDEFRRAP